MPAARLEQVASALAAEDTDRKLWVNAYTNGWRIVEAYKDAVKSRVEPGPEHDHLPAPTTGTMCECGGWH